MAPDLVILGLKGSPFVRKVQVFLAEKGVEYELEAVSPFPAPDWFAEINPAKRIPVLRDRSVGTEGEAGTLPDSSVVCAYVERKHPEPALYPKAPFEYGRALWIEEYLDTEVANLVGMGLFRPMVMSRLMGKEPDVERARATVNEKLPTHFDYLERQLGEGEYFVGGALGIADIAVATQFVNFYHAGAELDASRWPRLGDFVARMHSRPSFARCIEDERKILPPVETPL